MAIPQEWLPRQCRGVEGSRQGPHHDAVAQAMQARHERMFGGDAFKSIAPKDPHDLRCAQTSRYSCLGSNGAYVLPAGLSLDIFRECTEGVPDTVPHRAGPAEIGTTFRIARQVLVPEVQRTDQFADLDIRTVRQRDRRVRLTEPNPQDAIGIIGEFVDPVIRSEHCIGPADGARPQFIRPCCRNASENGRETYRGTGSISGQDPTSDF